jgi:hypothetical protein
MKGMIFRAATNLIKAPAVPLFAISLFRFNIFFQSIAYRPDPGWTLVDRLFRICAPRVRRLRITGLTFLEPLRRCHTPDPACDFRKEDSSCFPAAVRSIDLANLRQYAATNASSDGNVLILTHLSLLIV